MPLAQVARNFGISQAARHKWLKQANIDAGKQAGTTSELAIQTRELRKRHRLLEPENEILRAAAAYLSQANLAKKCFTRQD